MRNWLATILLILHTGLFMSGFVPTAAFCLDKSDSTVVTTPDGTLDREHQLPSDTQRDPRSESQEIPETGEPDPDYCNRHALLIHTGLHPEFDLIYNDENGGGKPCSVSADIHKPPPQVLA